MTGKKKIFFEVDGKVLDIFSEVKSYHLKHEWAMDCPRCGMSVIQGDQCEGCANPLIIDGTWRDLDARELTAGK